MSAAAISGTFADFRTIKSRAVVQLLIEVPIEQADSALRALGGVPQPHDPKWVAIAQLDPNAASKSAEPKERKAWADLKPSAQAAIRCEEPEFQAFLRGKGFGGVTGPAYAPAGVRLFCGVDSRKELDTNHRARVLWHQLDQEYLQAVGRLPRG